jgi:hypothetical protein
MFFLVSFLCCCVCGWVPPGEGGGASVKAPMIWPALQSSLPDNEISCPQGFSLREMNTRIPPPHPPWGIRRCMTCYPPCCNFVLSILLVCEMDMQGYDSEPVDPPFLSDSDSSEDVSDAGSDDSNLLAV